MMDQALDFNWQSVALALGIFFLVSSVWNIIINLRHENRQKDQANDVSSPDSADAHLVSRPTEGEQQKKINAQSEASDVRIILLRQMVHDFGSLLSSINFELETLKVSLLAKELEPSIMQTFELLYTQINSLNTQQVETQRLIKAVHPRIELLSEPTDLIKLARDVVATKHSEVISAGHRLIINDPTPVSRIWADQEKLKRVLSNLINNARQHGLTKRPSGGIIEVEITEREDYVELRVKDNGRGISKENLKKIWGWTYSTPRAGLQQGLGVGLLIVQKIVEAHQGTVDVLSEVGKGTTFILRFPVQTVGSQNDHALHLS